MCSGFVKGSFGGFVWGKEDGTVRVYAPGHATHTQRWQVQYHAAGTRPLYRGRFKNFATKKDAQLRLVMRYIERNGRWANLVKRAVVWAWSSLWRRENRRGRMLLSAWPVAGPADWTGLVNEPQSEEELAAIRWSMNRRSPFGDEVWREEKVKELGLESTMREPGRPRKMILWGVAKISSPVPFSSLVGQGGYTQADGVVRHVRQASVGIGGAGGGRHAHPHHQCRLSVIREVSIDGYHDA